MGNYETSPCEFKKQGRKWYCSFWIGCPREETDKLTIGSLLSISARKTNFKGFITNKYPTAEGANFTIHICFDNEFEELIASFSLPEEPIDIPEPVSFNEQYFEMWLDNKKNLPRINKINEVYIKHNYNIEFRKV